MDLDKDEIWTREKYLKMNTLHLSRALKTLRKLKGLTQDDVAVDAGLDTGYVSRVEAGKLVPSFKTLSNLLSIYGLTVKEFYDVLDPLAG